MSAGFLILCLVATILVLIGLAGCLVDQKRGLERDLRRERNLTRRLEADLGERYGADVASVREIRPGGDAA